MGRHVHEVSALDADCAKLADRFRIAYLLGEVHHAASRLPSTRRPLQTDGRLGTESKTKSRFRRSSQRRGCRMVAAAASCEQVWGKDLYKWSRYRVVRLGRCHRELCQYLIAQFLDTPCDLFRPFSVYRDAGGEHLGSCPAATRRHVRGCVVGARGERKACGESQFEDEAATEGGALARAAARVVGELHASGSEPAQVQAPNADRENLRFHGQVVSVVRLAVRVRASRERPRAEQAEGALGKIAELDIGSETVGGKRGGRRVQRAQIQLEGEPLTIERPAPEAHEAPALVVHDQGQRYRSNVGGCDLSQGNFAYLAAGVLEVNGLPWIHRHAAVVARAFGSGHPDGGHQGDGDDQGRKVVLAIAPAKLASARGGRSGAARRRGRGSAGHPTDGPTGAG